MGKTSEGISEAEFVDLYGEATFGAGKLTVTLNQALALEASYCTADAEKREDEDVRLRFLAQKIGAEALMPEHHYLLEVTEE